MHYIDVFQYNPFPTMDIKVLGTGCSSCQTLERRVREAVEQTGSDASVEKIEDMQQIMQYDVMSMPALVVDDEVETAGQTPSVKELTDLICTRARTEISSPGTRSSAAGERTSTMKTSTMNPCRVSVMPSPVASSPGMRSMVFVAVCIACG
ncbi:thioredoxin family protein [Salinibacter altiplanensis]|uniref:thioredoxin family protein n=1 Tax=Salinibacter altiplanensis TaxID=1803181 RepID=UPI003C6E849E